MHSIKLNEFSVYLCIKSIVSNLDLNCEWVVVMASLHPTHEHISDDKIGDKSNDNKGMTIRSFYLDIDWFGRYNSRYNASMDWQCAHYEEEELEGWLWAHHWLDFWFC